MVAMLSTRDGFDAALKTLRDGGLVAVPTETVYGLAADATSDEAVKRIFSAKGRPDFNPLICHVASLDQARNYGHFSPTAIKLAEEFWPGPLTLVVPQADGSNISALVPAGLPTIALRQPVGIMSLLAAALGTPIAAPSANTSGRVSGTTAQNVADDLGDKLDLVLDGGPCSVGLESTILRVEGERVTLLRVGGISKERIEHCIGSIDQTSSNSPVQAPGMLLAHYAPSIPLRLSAIDVGEHEALLAFGPPMPHTGTNLNLSETGNLDEAARNLFAMLIALERSGATGIAVQEVPMHGIGAAINDRLTRAAHGARKGNAST